MSDYALLAFKAGAKIIGGCCGTMPSHIGAMRGSLEQASTSGSYSADEHLKNWESYGKKRIEAKNGSGDLAYEINSPKSF